ncbi:glycoside hydrolase family 13 protein [Aeromicrobium panaciterrae]|uniref:glycoside hydrolase family 13 protein n=1 Tax=Aeromicrobium panaciterrae TaxID=363861 RepID=UPI0031CF12EC
MSETLATPRRATTEWWRDAAIYQVYPRSFADADGDGTGDLDGVRSKLPYLRDLGIDAVWFTPWYPSPMADGGYDVEDYRAIDPMFGTLAQAEALITDALEYGIRTIIDIVPNHISSNHRWFQEALAAGPGSPERERFWFRDGRGDEPPNNWISEFGGTPWSRVVGPDGVPEQWYLHLFAAGQPDVNWGHPDVREEYEQILRFWFDRGVSGVRIDSAALLAKDAELPDLQPTHGPGGHPYIDREDLQEIYRSWRRIAESYGGDRALIGEIWLPDAERFARYLRPDVLHSAFNFDFLAAAWDADRLWSSIETTTRLHSAVGAPATWVLSNHDVTRPVTRYGRADTAFAFETKRFGTPTDLELGRRRARAAAMLAMALPGSYYLFQGEELGLPEVEDIPLDKLQDPMHGRSGGIDPGRDGCRVPLPWSGTEPPYGFSPRQVDTWLPQPKDWAAFTAEAQSADPQSMLSLYRMALLIRRTHPDLGDGPMARLDAGPGVIAFRRGASFACVTNLTDHAVELPPHDQVWLASAMHEGGRLPADATAWLRLAS